MWWVETRAKAGNDNSNYHCPVSKEVASLPVMEQPMGAGWRLPPEWIVFHRQQPSYWIETSNLVKSNMGPIQYRAVLGHWVQVKNYKIWRCHHDIEARKHIFLCSRFLHYKTPRKPSEQTVFVSRLCGNYLFFFLPCYAHSRRHQVGMQTSSHLAFDQLWVPFSYHNLITQSGFQRPIFWDIVLDNLISSITWILSLGRPGLTP